VTTISQKKIIIIIIYLFIFGEFSSEKKRNLRENIPVSFCAHPSAKIGPKNKF
jgi:hypothetical protein